MANPAEILLDIFEGWNKQANTVRQARNDNELADHFRAVRLIEEIEELLDVMDSLGKRTRVYKKYLPLWKKTVFNYPYCWDSPRDTSINQVQREQLENLIDQLADIVPSPEPQQVQKLSHYLETILESLADDDTIPAELRDSAGAVVVNVRGCIEDLQINGDFAFQQAYERLIGCLAIVSLRSRNKKMWKGIMDKMVFPWGVNQLPSIESGAGTFAEITAAITGS